MTDAAPDLPPIARARYRVAQNLRVAWYAAHYAITRRLAERPRPDAETPVAETGGGGEGGDAPAARAALRHALMTLFRRDRANIAEGLYPPPRDLDPTRLPSALANSRRYFADLPDVTRRRAERRGGVEVREGIDRGRYPAYYAQNFHYQTDGWMSRRSAKLYDTQVEVLFTGAADAMRRAALAAVAREIRGRDQRAVSLIDVACGSGRFLEQTLDAFPRVRAAGLDLSPAYLEEAAERLARWPQTRLIEGNAECSPEPPAAHDVVVCIYLFHELPPRVRPNVAEELARLVKPGGLVVVADSLQRGDIAALDGVLAAFPRTFHEPYYASYLDEDLDALFTAAGLVPHAQELAFLTKVRTYRKPPA